MHTNEWKNLKTSSKTLTDEYIINNCDSLDLDYVFQANQLHESTLLQLIDLVDLRTLVRTQKFSTQFANNHIIPRLKNYSSKTPLELEEIKNNQKGDEWAFVHIEGNYFISTK
mgnify:CR=1 FL=1